MIPEVRSFWYSWFLHHHPSCEALSLLPLCNEWTVKNAEVKQLCQAIEVSAFI